MKRFALLFLCAFLVTACAGRRTELLPVPCERELPALFPAAAGPEGISIIAKARIDLPRYRLRGMCRIRYLPPDKLRVDFEHSSLFGAYREDTSVFIRGNRMEIYDRQRDLFYGTDSTRTLIGEAMELPVFPDDLIFALALRELPCAEIGDVRLRRRSDEWDLTGYWRSRRIAIEGKRKTGPSAFRLCIEDSPDCYIIRYGAPGEYGGVRFPSRITLSRENRLMRISMVVRKVTRGALDPALFRWSG